MSFDGSSPHRLILVFSNNTLQVFDVESRQFPEYCAAVCSAVSKRLEALHDSILGICCEPRDGGELSPPGSIVVWGSNWLGRLKFDQRPRGTNLAQNGARRRKLSSKAPTVFGAEDSDAQCVNVVTKFRQILGADFLATGELLVVERPLTDILPLLPPAYFRQKYGS
jgi:U3 small nucleolar RNA-associated protein 4